MAAPHRSLRAVVGAVLTVLTVRTADAQAPSQAGLSGTSDNAGSVDCRSGLVLDKPTVTASTKGPTTWQYVVVAKNIDRAQRFVVSPMGSTTEGPRLLNETGFIRVSWSYVEGAQCDLYRIASGGPSGRIAKNLDSTRTWFVDSRDDPFTADNQRIDTVSAVALLPIVKTLQRGEAVDQQIGPEDKDTNPPGRAFHARGCRLPGPNFRLLLGGGVGASSSMASSVSLLVDAMGIGPIWGSQPSLEGWFDLRTSGAPAAAATITVGKMVEGYSEPKKTLQGTTIDDFVQGIALKGGLAWSLSDEQVDRTAEYVPEVQLLFGAGVSTAINEDVTSQDIFKYDLRSEALTTMYPR